MRNIRSPYHDPRKWPRIGARMLPVRRKVTRFKNIVKKKPTQESPTRNWRGPTWLQRCSPTPRKRPKSVADQAGSPIAPRSVMTEVKTIPLQKSSAIGASKAPT